MKMKTTKVCKRKGCSNEFRLFKSTDTHCSYECAMLDQKNKPKDKQSSIPRQSDTRKRESYVYKKKRKIFLSQPENQICPVALRVFAKEMQTSQVHHKAGRVGRLYLYVPFWLAVSPEGHEWIHGNPKEAYGLGFLIKSSTVSI